MSKLATESTPPDTARTGQPESWLERIRQQFSLSAIVRRNNHHRAGSADEASAESESLIKLPVAPLSLHFFSLDLESEYRSAITRRYAPYIRIAVFLSTSLIIWFAAIDWYYMDRAREAFQLSLLLRAFVMLPAAIIFFFFTFSSKYATHGSLVAAIVMFCINICWAFPSFVGGSIVIEYFSSAMIQTLLFGTFLLNIRFIHVFAMSWCSLFVYWFVICLSNIPIDQKVYVIVELGVINQLLCFALYMIERLLRQSYYQQSLIESINIKRLDWLEMMTKFLRHELKNKIIGIRLSLELVQRKHADQQTQTYIRRGISNIETMSAVLNHTSEATSIEASLYTESRQYFNLSRCIAEQIDSFANVSGHDAIDFVPGSSQITIYGIEHRMVQLFENLLFNALDHAEDGTAVKVALLIEGNFARMSVTNRGKPLPDDHNAIYKLFETYRDNEKSGEDNVGLGLYLVKLIADAHGGSVHGMNLPDQNAVEFSVYLPLARSRRQPSFES